MLKFKDKICILMGLLIVSIMIIPYFILGTNSYVEIHDQLDGEVLNYIYHAKYFLKGNRIPEFMGGMSNAWV